MKRADVNTPSGVIYDTGFKRIYVKNIQKLTNDQICVLNAGDEVVKETGNQKHIYIVSYKEQGQGMCLTYTDATYVETVSYDLVDGVWTYNSTDSTELSGGGGGGSGETYTAGDGIGISAQNVISNTRKYYKHSLWLSMVDGCDESFNINLDFLTTTNTKITTKAELVNQFFEIEEGTQPLMMKSLYNCVELGMDSSVCYFSVIAYNSERDKFELRNSQRGAIDISLASIDGDFVSEIQ